MDEFERAAAILEETGRYRILRRVQPLSSQGTAPGEPTAIGMVLDIETTGLDPDRDEIIELGAVKFEYGDSGRIYRVLDTFSQLHEPSRSIPSEITRLTGITDTEVAGRRIDDAAVQAFAADAELIIAHNARFDRPRCEGRWPVFRDKDWACSCHEVPWLAEGHRGTKLEYLLSDFGFFHRGHRAVDDCYAVLTLLGQRLRTSGQSALGSLLKAARASTIRLWAVGSPMETNAMLKQRSYRWSTGRRSWYINLDEGQLEAERTFLSKEVFGRPVLDLPVERLSALGRFSSRSNLKA